MSFHYKLEENYSNDSSKRLIDCRGFENFGDQQKSKIEINEIILNCLRNIPVAYQSGNTVRLYNQLSCLNKITMEYYFIPNSDFFSTTANSIPDILMKISFDKSDKFSLKCKIAALSIIDNLTFEKIYGFYNLFYELDIINLACINLFSDEIKLILYYLRILLNYCEMQDNFAEEILMICPLDNFIMFILNIDDDKKSGRRIKDAALSLICELSFVSSDKFTPCFYATVHYLIQNTSSFQEKSNFEKYIFWIAINCIKSDCKCIEQFYENTDLINLITNVINNQCDDASNFKSAVILLDNLYQKNNFLISELNLTNIMLAIPAFYSDDLLVVSLLRVLKAYGNQPQFSSLTLDNSFISMLSEMFFNSNYSIKAEIIELLCIIIEFATPEFLILMVHVHIIQMIYEIYISDSDYLKNILLISLVKLLDNAVYFNDETQSLFTEDINEIDFTLFDEDRDTMDDNQLQLIIQLKQSYDNYIRL